MAGGLRGGMIGIVIAAAAIALGLGWLAQRLDGDKREVRSSIVAPEKPVVMRTRGGLLEVATVRALERFTREDSRDFWGIDLGTTVSQIQVPVTYRFHIEMAREWPIEVRGLTAIARARPHRLPPPPYASDLAFRIKRTRLPNIRPMSAMDASTASRLDSSVTLNEDTRPQQSNATTWKSPPFHSG